LLGDWASNFKLVVFEVERSFLFAVLPPGAFVGLGLLIALKNYLDQKVKAREQAKAYRNIPTTS
ncbi:MAG: electron transport complex subunit RsxE, partial [Gammaproteobacteria bacterium]|nr:electron transport complex subunit RsxE [Gammaproteobacteria bacterium]